MSGFRFRISGFRFRVSGSGFGFQVSGVSVHGFGFRGFGIGFEISGFGFRVSGLNTGVHGEIFRRYGSKCVNLAIVQLESAERWCQRMHHLHLGVCSRVAQGQRQPAPCTVHRAGFRAQYFSSVCVCLRVTTEVVTHTHTHTHRQGISVKFGSTYTLKANLHPAVNPEP